MSGTSTPGCENFLLQDEDRELSRWLSARSCLTCVKARKVEDFFNRVRAFNAQYRIPAPVKPELHGGVPERIVQFQNMLYDELREGGDIKELVEDGAPSIEVLTAMADWLGDIMVYAASEATRYGIPLPEVLDIIMDSNASKLMADGTAKFKDGKLQKGPNYWKPEPKIRALLEEKLK